MKGTENVPDKFAKVDVERNNACLLIFANAFLSCRLSRGDSRLFVRSLVEYIMVAVLTGHLPQPNATLTGEPRCRRQNWFFSLCLPLSSPFPLPCSAEPNLSTKAGVGAGSCQLQYLVEL